MHLRILGILLLLTYGLTTRAEDPLAHKPLSHKALRAIANAEPVATGPSIKELSVIPLIKHWNQRTIWEYFDGDVDKQRYRGSEHWSSDGKYHVSRVTHMDGVLQLEEEQVFNLTTYDAEKKKYLTYLVDEEEVIVAEGDYDAEKKSMTFEGKSTSDETAILFTIRFKPKQKLEMNIDLYYDGERMATGRSRVAPLKETQP